MENKKLHVDKLGGYSIGLKMVDWIFENLKSGSTVLELGSGYGSDFLKSSGYNMISVEHDKKWLNKYSTKYLYAPLVDNLWYDREILSKHIRGIQYDLLLVDAPPRSHRRWAFWKNRDLFNLSVPILMDDTCRVYEKRIAFNFMKLGYSVQFIKDGRKEFAIIKKSA